ncbi:MAG: hypothetical protein ABI743_09765 [bacterium]
MIRPLARLLPASLMLILGLLAISCSGPNAATPTLTPAAASPKNIDEFQAQFDHMTPEEDAALSNAFDALLSAQLGQSRVNLGEYHLVANLETGDYRIEAVQQTRNGQTVANVTSALMSPLCPNGQCVNFVLNRRDVGTGFTSYTLYIYNPSTTVVYDTRFIWTNLQDTNRDADGKLITTDDVLLLNPKGWTNEFDDYGSIPIMAIGAPDYTAFGAIVTDTAPKWPPINPFHTLASNQTDQSLGGKKSAFTEVQATVKSTTLNISFMVTASPTFQRQDPYDVVSVTQIGLVDDNVNGKGKIKIKVRDHQANVGFTVPPDPDPTHLGIEFHSPSFYQSSNPEILQATLLSSAGDTSEYQFDVTNWQVKKAGKYPFYIRVHSDVNPAQQAVNYDLYWKGDVLVVSDPSGGGGGGGPTQNTIAYVSSEFGDNDIIISSLTGGNKINYNGVVDINENGADDIDPSLGSTFAVPGPTAAKRWIAWASDRGTPGNYRVWMWDYNRPPGSIHTFATPTAVTSPLDDCRAPDLSPNNDALVCQCKGNGGSWEIRRYPVTISFSDALPPIIGSFSRLTKSNTGDNQNPSYNRNGQFIVFDSTRIRQDNPEIYAMDGLGENVMINRLTYRAGEDRDPVWASGPGFDQILFQTNVAGNWDIQVVTFTSGLYIPPVASGNIVLKSVITGSDDDVTPNVSPDGRQVIFATNRDASGDFEIFTANAGPGGGGETKRTSDSDDQRRPDWGNDLG